MHAVRFVYAPSPGIRRLITGLAVLAYLASVWGYPLPGSSDVDYSTPFPCQGHHCGCQSADQCWHSCCCFTPAERLAWAEAHGVTIPAAAREVLFAAVGDSHEPQRATCCAHTADPHHEHDDTSVACTAQHCEHAGEEVGHPCVNCKSHKAGGVDWVLGIEARKCRGLSTDWIASGASLPLVIVPLWQFDWASAGRVTTVAPAFASVIFSPAEPPPRA
ncbi:MAG: hypothetical protein AB7O59_21325 [Pirellulales bacterium]